MKKVFVTRIIPEEGIKLLREKGYVVDVCDTTRPLTKKELIKKLRKGNYDAVLSLLTDTIDEEVLEAAPTVRIFANYAIGFNNFNIEAAQKKGVYLSNTPGGGAERVAEHAWALILALSCRIVEGDAFVKRGKYSGWDPMIFWGQSLTGKTLGIIGTGKIGAEVARRGVKGFGMNVVYYDIRRNEALESEFGAVYKETPEEVIRVADVISLHVPLTPETTHLINTTSLSFCKKNALLINTARGPVVDEVALVEALKTGKIAGAGLDVFEREPELAKGLAKLSNVILTPHIASATHESRIDMAIKSASNIIAVLEGGLPLYPVYPSK